MKLWTIQAPEVAAQLARGTAYRASWERVIPAWIGAYEVMAAEMTARGIDCRGAPPTWTWPGWASPKDALYVADFLLGLDQWAHGVVMLRLAVPDDQVLCTSYSAWNHFLNPDENRDGQPPTMDFRGVLLSKYDSLQATIPQIKARWVRRAQPMTIPRDARRDIRRDPNLRHLLVPPKRTARQQGLWLRWSPRTGRGWLPHHPNKSRRVPEPGDDGCAMTDRRHPAHTHFGPRFEHWSEVRHDVSARGNVIAA